MPKFDTRGNGLAAAGNKYTFQATTAGVQVSSTVGVRCTRIWAAAGTGTIDVYDGTSVAGVHVIAIATSSATPVTYDIPLTVGLFLVVGAATTAVVVYSE